MTLFLLNILLALSWMALSSIYSPENFFAGFALSYFVLWLAQRGLPTSNYFRRVPRVLGFAIFFIWELVVANLKVAYEVLTPRHGMRPGIIAIPLDTKNDGELTLLANLITLTPGTLSLDVSSDRDILFVHTMYVDDIETFRREIKTGFERRVREIME